MATMIYDKCLPFLEKAEDRELVKKLLAARGFEKQPTMDKDSRDAVRAYWEECERICKEHNIQIDGC